MYQCVDPGLGVVLIEQGPLVLATTNDGVNDNVCCLSWLMPLSLSSGYHNIALCTGPWNTTYTTLKKTGEITICVPIYSAFRKVVSTGSVSFEECANKFKRFGLKKLPGVKNKCPIIDGCAGYLECRFAKEYPEDNIVILDTINVGIDRNKFSQPKIHAVGDGSFTFDGKIVNGRQFMGGKIPSNTQEESYMSLVGFPKFSRKMSYK